MGFGEGPFLDKSPSVCWKREGNDIRKIAVESLALLPMKDSGLRFLVHININTKAIQTISRKSISYFLRPFLDNRFLSYFVSNIVQNMKGIDYLKKDAKNKKSTS